ncbi:uncharacterized protein EDB91DRAFT_1085158 [Suillus paluster]|uniref:uncharacterized protein n=1 Tax=Suillus paluster TaxID=48578 RepID=UPI001B85B8CD|nr:uncharacterized protein EDB91DRAFT_1085158 [Suillus paluster]KAG1731222.1 hypothetical protein EDB91DRAFT_1085158 [Suillus paluster]
MTAVVDWAANKANAGFLNAANKVEHLLGQALQLKPANPKHIAIAMEMAASLSFTFSSYAYSATSVPPMVLSTAAEIHEHLDDSSCNVVSAPVWSNICPDDLRSQHSPLYPLTLAYGKPSPPTNPPVAGPSGSNTAVAQDANVLAGKGKGKAREDPEAEPTEQRSRGMERKRLRCMSAACSQSRAPKAKRPHATSKAMITSEDEWELDMADIPQQQLVPEARKKASLPTRLPPTLKKTRSQSKSFTITSDNEEDAEPTPKPPPKKKKMYVEIDNEEMTTNVGPAPKMGTPYVQVPPAPSAIADPNTWLPGCGPCVHQGLICLQGYNNSGAALTVCEACHRLKHKCGGNGSAIPTTKAKKPVATTTRQGCSKSRCRASPVHVSPETATPAAASTSGAPAPVVATTAAPTPTSTPIPIPTPTPTTTPITAPATAAAPTAASTPDGPADASVVALKEQIEVLQSTVTSLEAKASIGEKRLLEANQRLADQEATSKLLAEQFEELRRQLLPPPVPASPVAACLPVIIGNLSGNNKNIGAAEDGAEPASGAIAEAEEVAESASGVVAGLSGNNMDVEEDLAESASTSGGNNMDVAEAPAKSAPASGINAGLSSNTNDVAEAESASIASSAQE